MAVWIVVLGLLWPAGVFGVPAFRPWCDYSHPRTESHLTGAEEATIGTVYDDAETSWSPPGWHCAQGNPLAEQQRRNGGPVADPWYGRDGRAKGFQLFLVLAPILLWYAASDSEVAVAHRRRIAGGFVIAALGLTAWGIAGVCGTSKGIGAVYLAMATVLAAGGVVYRRLHLSPWLFPPTPTAKDLGNHSLPPDPQTEAQ